MSQTTVAQPLPQTTAIHGMTQTQTNMAQTSTTPLASSMTPSTHPPPYLLASLPPRFVGQPQPSPFLAPPSNYPSSHTRKSTSMSQPPLSASLLNPYSMPPPHPHHFVPAQEQFVPAQELGLQDPDMVARESLHQMNEMSRRAATGTGYRMSTSTSASPPSGSGSSSSPGEQSDLHMQRTGGMHQHSHRVTQQQQQQPPAHASMQGGDAPFLLPPDMSWDAPMTHEGLQVFTVGHLLPRSSVEDQNGNWMFDPSPSTGSAPSPAEGEGEGEGGNDNDNLSQPPEPDPEPEEVVRPTPSNGRPSTTTPTTIRVRRSTFVPGWAVPPRVLLVDDDAVSRRLSSKFLQVFGCCK
jgi:osomolarity two-component system response regulator SKN7